ncbi:unnamed protein product [Brachionus calyciflorus]|uniref:RING-type domain-containing protein n=1 Tax=Brachionus calyciflorus TaxID=104777 RepID=A0A813MA12_9BILA|nr:unnamed protein product [Brachionus calyciflorus]
MGLCKCQKRKVTNLFCFEHDVNVCEYCLVSDHERCIVQSYVQWLQDSEYNPICILCKKLLSEEPTVRLICYDVFHWACLDKYASELPENTAPAGYQCPKCKECIFPPGNLVSPVVDVLKQKLETTNWARVGLGQTLIQIDEVLNPDENLKIESDIPKVSSMNNLLSQTTDDESNGFVIVKDKLINQEQNQVHSNLTPQPQTETVLKQKKADQKTANLDYFYENVSKNRANFTETSNLEPFYDPSLGVVLNIDNLDRDTGENKYKRRPLFEWFSRFLRSRQISSKFRMTRQKKILYLIILAFMGLFTLIIIFSRLGSLNTEDDPAFDPLNNPNIRVQ